VTLLGRLDEVYRRTGANLPLGDPRPSHGAEMEGYFWRVTDVAAGRVLVVLCSVNSYPDGDWATVAVAAHPGGFVRSAVLDGAHASSDRFLVTAGDGSFTATGTAVHVDLGGDARVDLELGRPVLWPLVLGGGGLFSALPFLGQYWHPHLLGGGAAGSVRVGDQAWELTDGEVYAEKNWGAGFPERWWWGQAQGFDRPDVCVAFGGGRLTAGALGLSESTRARPVQAALSSAASFVIGGSLPLVALVMAPASVRTATVVLTAIVALMGLGLAGAKAGGAPVWRAAVRVGIGGSLAMAATAGVGHLFGVVAG